jgi:hypothetical protein
LNFDYWCIIPFRVRTTCREGNSDKIHANSIAGANQMNPFYYIHLEDVGEDIRGSHIAIYLRRCSKYSNGVALCVNFLDGRYRNLINMPIDRLDTSFQSPLDAPNASSWSVCVVYLNLILEWWSDVLYTFNNQLIEEVSLSLFQKLVIFPVLLEEQQEKRLQVPDSGSDAVVNKRLHIMAAHLHRYGSELGRVEDIVTELQRHCSNPKITALDIKDDHMSDELSQTLSQAKAIRTFGLELERKTENVLALVR